MKQEKYNFFSKNFNPLHLIILYTFIVIPFFLINSLIYKFILVFIFYTLCILNNKKISLVYNMLVLLSVVFFNILIPSGKILYSINGFSITKDSLVSGLQKSLNLIGFVFLSLFCVQKNINLPSKLGKMLSSMFYYNQKINKIKYGKIKYKTFIHDIDNFLFSLSQDYEDRVEKNNNNTTLTGYIFIFLLILLNYLLLYLEKNNFYYI